MMWASVSIVVDLPASIGIVIKGMLLDTSEIMLLFVLSAMKILKISGGRN